jgi:hypothetical protein
VASSRWDADGDTRATTAPKPGVEDLLKLQAVDDWEARVTDEFLGWVDAIDRLAAFLGSLQAVATDPVVARLLSVLEMPSSPNDPLSA